MGRQATTSITGLTLIEIQIATVLLVLVVLLGYSSLHVAVRSWRTVEAVSRDIENRYLISQFLRHQLEQSVSLVLVGNGERRLLFYGTSTWLYFAGRLPDHRGGGLYLIRIAYRNRNLEFSYRPLIGSTDLSDDTLETTMILLEDVTGITFSYYGRRDEDSIPTWGLDWNEPDRLPALIQLRVKTADAGMWLDMIVGNHSVARMGRPEQLFYSTTATRR